MLYRIAKQQEVGLWELLNAVPLMIPDDFPETSFLLSLPLPCPPTGIQYHHIISPPPCHTRSHVPDLIKSIIPRLKDHQ